MPASARSNFSTSTRRSRWPSLYRPRKRPATVGQNYASRWALCHFLVYNPNYAQQFLLLGRGFLAGKDVNFEQTFGGVSRQLFFEYLFFLEHIGPGYRVDLCGWDWKKKFSSLPPGQSVTAAVVAGRGWQPSRPDGPAGDVITSTWPQALGRLAGIRRPSTPTAMARAAAGWWVC